MVTRIEPLIRERIISHPLELSAYSDYYTAVVCKSDNTKYNEWLREQCLNASMNEKASESDKSFLIELYYTLLKLIAPDNFDAYLLYVEKKRPLKERFYLPRRKKLKVVVDAMQDLYDDKLDLLTISLPPGTGKSTLGIFFLSWIMGKNPNDCNLASAHSGILTKSFYDGVLQIITDADYAWDEVFPDSFLYRTNSKEQTIDINSAKRFSSLTCRAIGASLTGATRCNRILYADDLCSGIEEALSPDRLAKLWQLYLNDLKSRKKDGCKEIHIATRWSVNDVIGRIEAMYGSEPRAKFIVIPALNEDGESNFEYDYGVGFSTEYFLDMQSVMDDASFKALYMNQPIEREGLLYHPDDLRWYYTLPSTPPDAIIGVCDTKDKGSDYGFLPVGYKYGNDYYIEDCVCDNGNPENVEAKFTNILLKHNVQMCRFESNSAGGRIAQTIQEEIKKRNGITHITVKYTTENKETKILVNSPWVKEHCLFKSGVKKAENEDYFNMLKFLTGHSLSSKMKHDDVPDGMAMFALFCQSLSSAKVEIFKRPF